MRGVEGKGEVDKEDGGWVTVQLRKGRFGWGVASNGVGLENSCDGPKRGWNGPCSNGVASQEPILHRYWHMVMMGQKVYCGCVDGSILAMDLMKKSEKPT
ncbi:hypothetical protein VNO78_02768 [Psophocarpus tetragonolobus]|uniref:Uncharacterized protein n=1 Tax=Psophocarpus tetragonolobus TaxID=3891 RepID=A0AAN9TCN5_PSOTE